MRRLALVVLLAAAVAGVAACGGGGEAERSSPIPAPATETAPASGNENGNQAAEEADPRDDGFEVALGEWALTAETDTTRPGRTTLVVTNRGTMPHGFEIEREDGDDSSGSGSADDEDKVETRILEPGESVEVELSLSEGVYKLECNVEGHDDMGMEMLLEVRPNAQLAAKPAAAPSKSTAVTIEAFAFAPPTFTTQVGQEITWENHDPADHTVTGEDGSFDSGTMAQGAKFKTSFDSPGEYRYICELHPGMKGRW
jgi:plastocyanin